MHVSMVMETFNSHLTYPQGWDTRIQRESEEGPDQVNCCDNVDIARNMS